MKINLVKKTLFIFILTCFSSTQSFAFFSLFSEKKQDQRKAIFITGSSTISPIAAAVSEEFSRIMMIKEKKVKTPIVTSTGTGKGFELFCSGIGLKYPDFNSASRKISADELETCHKNGVNNILEIKIGYDGIVFGDYNKVQKISLTKEQIFLALAAEIFDKESKKFIPNPYKNWQEINKNLPNLRISIYGPPKTSGTREVFEDLVMQDKCLKYTPNEIVNLNKGNLPCFKIREDGVFIESGENDDILISHLKQDHNSFGIFGFNFLITNGGIIKSVPVDGYKANFENISSKKYPLSRPLFIYFKKEHLKLFPEMKEFIFSLIDSDTIGKKGYLVYNGLVPLTNSELYKVQNNVMKELR